MLTICDTHALIFDFLSPDQLGSAAARAIDEAEAGRDLACADTSLWEIAMLVEKRRIPVPASTEEFILAQLTARRIEVLPITPAIAAVASSGRIPWRDPFDCLIAAAAIVHQAALVTRDRRMAGIPGLSIVW